MIDEKNETESMYNPQLDITIQQSSKHHPKAIRLKDVNALRKARELKREEYEQDAAMAAGLYAEIPQQPGGL